MILVDSSRASVPIGFKGLGFKGLGFRVYSKTNGNRTSLTIMVNQSCYIHGNSYARKW